MTTSDDSGPDVLYFKSSQAAYEYTCECMTEPVLEPGSRVYGIVTEVTPGKDWDMHTVKLTGRKQIILQLGPETFTINAKRRGFDVEPIRAGDFVLVHIIARVPLRDDFWIWSILCRLKPEWHMKRNCYEPDFPDGYFA